MFTLSLQEQTDDEMMMIQSYAHAFVMTLLLLCSVLKHMCLIICVKIEKKKKRTSLQNSKSFVRFGKGGQTKVLSRLCLFGFVSQLKEAG